MSYDIYLDINTGNHMHTVVDVGNYTSNVGGMWRKALEATATGYTWLSDLHEMNAGHAIPVLQAAIQHMKTHEEDYTPMNPANGWGSYEGAVAYLENLLHACEKHPACTINISH